MSKSERVKMTLLLDSETITLLRKYTYNLDGSTNVSKAVMLLAKRYADKQKENS